MRTKTQRLVDFVDFSQEHKVPRMLKRMSDEQLTDLCERYLPLTSLDYSAETPEVLRNKGVAVMVMGAIGSELQRRYPHNAALRSINYNNPKEISQFLHRTGGQKNGQ